MSAENQKLRDGDFSPSPCSQIWCDECKKLSEGKGFRSGIYIPGCEHDTWQRRMRQLLAEIELHCPCGARPESIHTHPHVIGCPVDEAIRLFNSANDQMRDGR